MFLEQIPDTSRTVEMLKPFYDVLKTIIGFIPWDVILPLFILILFSLFLSIKSSVGGDSN